MNNRPPDTRVRLIRNERNLGFAAGVNRGAEAASGRWLLLMNPDIHLKPGLPAIPYGVCERDVFVVLTALVPGARIHVFLGADPTPIVVACATSDALQRINLPAGWGTGPSWSARSFPWCWPDWG